MKKILKKIISIVTVMSCMSALTKRLFLCTIPAGEYKSGKIKVSSDDYIVFAFPAPCAVEGTVL